MKTERQIIETFRARPTLEGAGVRLYRAFADHHPRLDPFLLLDDFHSRNPRDYLPGFPWHPHRGIETITYMINGEVAHGDSLGNSGVIHPGDVQWMTAGSGIVHQEMPQEPPDKLLHGFQLWANLPRKHKMMDPRYRDITRADIPEAELDSGCRVKVICGECEGIEGPVKDIVTEPQYLDVFVPPNSEFVRDVPASHNAFAYMIEGEASLGAGKGEPATEKTLVILGDGEQIRVRAGASSARFLLISGRPLHEPVAWRGPIVMNTEEELDVAFAEYREGTFLKHGAKKG